MTQTRLDSLQADFVAALFDKRLAANVASAWSGGDRVVERLALHRGNLFAAWEKSLGNAFPVIRAVVGINFFTLLARDYGYVHPSMCGDLNRFGEKLADFIRTLKCTNSLPYLGDLADLEWAVHRGQFAADITPLSADRLAAYTPGQLLAARFSVDAACSWIPSKYPIASIWLAHQDTAIGFPTALDVGEYALVCRPNWHTRVAISSRSEIAALSQLREGKNMETALRAALDAESTYDVEPALVRWLNLGVLGERQHA